MIDTWIIFFELDIWDVNNDQILFMDSGDIEISFWTNTKMVVEEKQMTE